MAWESFVSWTEYYRLPKNDVDYYVVGRYTGYVKKQKGEWEVEFEALGGEKFWLNSVWVNRWGSTLQHPDREELTNDFLADHQVDQEGGFDEEKVSPESSGSEMDSDGSDKCRVRHHSESGEDSGSKHSTESSESSDASEEPQKAPRKKRATSAPKPKVQRAKRRRSATKCRIRHLSDDDTDDDASLPGDPADQEDANAVVVPSRWDDFSIKSTAVPTEIVFEKHVQARPSHSRYSSMTIYDIFLDLGLPMLNKVLECTNESVEDTADRAISQFRMGELLSWCGLKVFTGIINLPNMKEYFYPELCHSVGVSIPPFTERLTYNRYLQFMKTFRFESYDLDEVPVGDPAWKVRSITRILQETLRSTLPAPNQRLCVDETMVLCTIRRCPIRQHVSNKPTDTGFKFYCIVDWETKIMYAFNPHDGIENSANCSAYPGGFTGRQVMKLVQVLPGMGYIVFIDNYYGGVGLAKGLSAAGHGLICTVRKGRFPPIAEFPYDKPNPNLNRIRGTTKTCSNLDNSVHVYAFLDTKACYFIDTVYGGSVLGTLKRRIGATVVEFNVPKAICEYNKYMGAVDTFDQLRGGRFGLETGRRAVKWTIRYFETLLSMVINNTFLIQRAYHDNPLERDAFMSQLFKLLFFNNFDVIKIRKLSPSKVPNSAPIAYHNIREIPLMEKPRTANRQPVAKRLECVRCEYMIGDKRNWRRRTRYYCPDCCVPLCKFCNGPFHHDLLTNPLKPRPKPHPKLVSITDK